MSAEMTFEQVLAAVGTATPEKLANLRAGLVAAGISHNGVDDLILHAKFLHDTRFRSAVTSMVRAEQK